MPYLISGFIRERESKLGISGLIVRARDKDGTYDHLLGSVVTDAKGGFRMAYEEKPAAKLFTAKPIVYLQVYAPPFRFLLDSPGVRWGAKTAETFQLEVPRDVLGSLSPARPAGVVEAGLDFARSALRLERQGQFTLPALPGLANAGPVGAPALPELDQYIALPPGAKIRAVEIHPGEPVRLPVSTQLWPVQHPEPALETRLSDHTFVDVRHAFVPLGARYLKRTAPYPERLVVQGPATTYSSVQLVRMRVRPVQYDAARSELIFYPKLRYTVRYDTKTARPPRRWSTARLEEVQALFDAKKVFYGREIGMSIQEGLRDDIPFLKTDVPMVIITDDHQWPEHVEREGGGTRAPATADATPIPVGDDDRGGLVKQFEELARWKTQRGLRTRVVTVHDIVAGKYGDCTGKGRARDLQEVIRSFIKQQYPLWEMKYVLLGGAHAIIPLRSLLAHVTCEGEYAGWDCYPYTGDEEHPAAEVPPRTREVVGTNPKRVHLCHQSNHNTPTTQTPLCTERGKVVPFKREPGKKGAGGVETLGWYFASKDFEPLPGVEEAEIYPCKRDYEHTKKGTSVCNIIVEGPQSTILDNYYWAFDGRYIQSDLYYAALPPPQEEPGGLPLPGVDARDFDLNGNGLYGQYRWDEELAAEVTLDSTYPTLPSLAVGRVPALTGKEAGAFVDKVLTYERLETPEGEPVDPAYLQDLVLAADLWGDTNNQAWQERHWLNDGVPDAGKFIYRSDPPSVVAHLQQDLRERLTAGPDPSLHVAARFHEAGRASGLDVECQYSAQAPAGHLPRWHYVKKQQGQYVHSAEPTDFVELTGPVFQVPPWRVTWFYDYPRKKNRATAQAEEVRNIFAEEFPELGRRERYYADYEEVQDDLLPAQPLTAAAIGTALDKGCHFVSLIGHGSPDGCAMVKLREFKNRGRSFIAFAKSCSTAHAQGTDRKNDKGERSLGEESVVCEKGGAVAYVGNTRMGVSDNAQQELFWRSVRDYGRLGPAAGMQSGIILYQVYNQILYGDPEMPVWTRMPLSYQVVHPRYVDRKQATLVVEVLHDNAPLPLQRVTLTANWPERGTEPEVLLSAVTNAEGRAGFDTSELPATVSEITITVVPGYFGGGRRGFKPFTATLPVCEVSYQQGWRRCTKCQALFYCRSGSSNGRCPVDQDPHTEAAGEQYRLIANSGLPADLLNVVDWRWCKKCQSLFYGGDLAGVCHDGQAHVGTSSGDYQVEGYYSDEHAGSEWRRCDACGVLHLTQDSAGKCYKAGNDHHVPEGRSYVLPVS